MALFYSEKSVWDQIAHLASAVVVLKNGRNPWTVYEMLHERFYPYEWSVKNWHKCCCSVVVEHLQNLILRVGKDDEAREL